MRSRGVVLAFVALAVLLMAAPRQTIAAVYAEEMRLAIEAKRAVEFHDRIQAAREDVNEFIEFCFGLKQAPLHRRLQEHWNTQRRTVDLFPIEHGKTTQAAGRMVWLLGKFPERQGAYVTSGDKPARKTVSGVARVILNNPRVRLVFPDLYPETEEGSTTRTCWGAEAIRVNGAPTETLERDPSLAGFGYSGQITGSRLHWIFVDNVCNKDNTFSARVRDSVLESLDNDVFPRCLDGGEIHITDTSWYDDDPPHVIGKRPVWSMRVEDAERGDAPGQTLWPAQWPWARLTAKRGEISSVAYDRTMRNITTSKSRGTFKKAAWDDACGPQYGWTPALTYEDIERWQERSVVVTAVDLAVRKEDQHDLTVLQTGRMAGDKRRLLHTTAERLELSEIGRAILDCYRNLHQHADYSLFVVEDNAAQDYVVQMFEDAGLCRGLGATASEASRIRVVGRTTTRRKNDEDLGIPGLAADIEMGRWQFPEHHETRELWEEMKRWAPGEHTGDRLMALWLLNEHLRGIGDACERPVFGGTTEASRL